jgi:hypothetical protein
VVVVHRVVSVKVGVERDTEGVAAP